MSQTHSFPTGKPSDPWPLKRKPGRPAGRGTAAQTSELAYGQSVIVTARWILVIAGFCLVLWNPDEIGDLRLQIGVILLLAFMNFFLQAQILMKRPALEPVIYAASLLDFAVITLLVWAHGGFTANTFIFYLPAILAISVAFETALVLGYVGGAIAIYGLICMATGGFTAGNMPVLIARILMLIAVAFCGNLYWHIERGRRQAAIEAHEALLAEVRQRQTRRPQTRRQEVQHADAS